MVVGGKVEAMVVEEVKVKAVEVAVAARVKVAEEVMVAPDQVQT